MKFKRVIKRILGAGALSFMLCSYVLSFGGVAYADENTSSGENSSTDSNNNNNNNNNNAGQSLYEALSRIYGNSTNNGANNGNTNVNNNGTNNGNNSNQKQIPLQDQIMQGMESEVKGPTVDDGGLSEYYHQNYRVYEESLNDDVSIFTNVANGSVVNRAVVLDIPDGVAARMKKDGKSVSVRSEEPITEPGSYVLTLFVLGEDQESVPFSQQKISKAKFRFRIQYEAGVAGYEAVEGEEGLTSIPGVPESETVSGNGSVSGNASLLFGEEDGDYLPDDLRPDDYDFDMATVSGDVTEEAPEETSERTTPEEAFLAANGMNGEYDPGTGFYKNTLLTKDYFFTNVPNGMISNEPVMIQAADNLNYTVYKNGDLMEDYKAGQYIKDDGSYTVFVSGTGDGFESAYGDDVPVFHFRVITAPVSDLGIVNAPENMTFRSVRYEGEDVSGSAILSPDTVRLINDGNYEITMDSANGSTEVILSRDTLQPLFDVSVVPNLATITYKTGDVDHCTLYRNDELVSDTGTVTEITEAGSYTLTAYDKAGNSSSASFRVSYRINAGAVIAILIALGLIGGLIFYLLRIRKKVAIR